MNYRAYPQLDTTDKPVSRLDPRTIKGRFMCLTDHETFPSAINLDGRYEDEPFWTSNSTGTNSDFIIESIFNKDIVQLKIKKTDQGKACIVSVHLTEAWCVTSKLSTPFVRTSE